MVRELEICFRTGGLSRRACKPGKLGVDRGTIRRGTTECKSRIETGAEKSNQLRGEGYGATGLA